MIEPSTLVADIVTANPASSRVFERHQIDFCCQGQRPLDQACATAGLQVDTILGELEHVDGEPVTEPVPDEVGGLIGRILTTHHTYLRRELPRLAGLMGNVVSAHASTHPEVHEVAALLTEITDDLLPHLAKEEQVLFPLAIQLLGAVEPTTFHCGSILNPIRVMHAEHDRVGQLLGELRQQTGDYAPPPDACPTWRALYHGLADLEADTHLHVHLENNVLFERLTQLEASLK